MSGFWGGFVVGALVVLVVESAIEAYGLRRFLKRTGTSPDLQSFLRRIRQFGV